MARNPALDITYNCLGYDRFGNYGQGILSFSPIISGLLTGISINCTPLTFNILISASFISSIPQSGDTLDFSSGVNISGNLIIGPGILAKIKWSSIGEFDFTIDKKNLAGEMPLDWRGTVWQILQLGSKIIVYGSGGISLLTPHNESFGRALLSSVGIASEWSVVDTEYGHFFISKNGKLGIIKEDVEYLGYEEFFSPMINPVLLYDNFSKLIYICDGISGYIYNPQLHSLGTGPSLLTGIGYSRSEEYILGSFTAPNAMFITDVFDFGTRNRKTLKEIEVGTNLVGNLEISIFYRLSINSDFSSTEWYKLTPEGRITIPCFGEEFKIGIRCLTLSQFKIDYLKFIGVIHRYNPLEGQEY